MLSRRTVCILILLALILPLTSLTFPQPQTGTVRNAEPPAVADLPNLHIGIGEYHDFWWHLNDYLHNWLDNYLHYVESILRERIGCYTNDIPEWLQPKPLIPLAYASTDWGITSTGSTSYPSTNVGNTTAGGNSIATNRITCLSVTLSNPGTAKSISYYTDVNNGDVKVGIYDDSGGYPYNLLVGPVENTVGTVGTWITVTITNTYLGSGTYWICANTGDTGALQYTAVASTKYDSLTYSSAWPNPESSSNFLSSSSIRISLYLTYVQIEGYTKGTLVQYTGATTADGAVSSFKFYTHTGAASDKFVMAFYNDSAGSPNQRLWYSSISGTGSASTTWNTVTYASGTTDNSWAGALTQNAYYWFMWQWDNTDSGPSYAAGSANTGIYLAQAYGTLLSTWSGGTLSTENWSMYLTYSTTQDYPKSVADTLGAVDALGRNFGAKRSTPDSTLVTDLVSKLRNVPTSIADIQSIVDSLSRNLAGGRTLTDTLTLVDALIKGAGKPLTEALIGTDTLALRYIGQRALTDILAFTDSLTRLRDVPKTLTDSLSITDLLSKVLTAQRTFTEIFALSDSLAYLRNVPTSISDALAILDNLGRTYIGQRTNTDILVLADQLAHTTGKPLTETVSLADLLSRALVAQRNPAETIQLSDILSHLIGKPLTDIITESDALTRSYVGLRSASDIDTLIGTLSIGVGKPLAENLIVSDLLSRFFIGQINLSDTLTISDALAHLIGKQASDLIAIVDSLSRGYIGARSNTDIMTFTDQLTHEIGKPLIDTSQLSDSLLRSLIASRGNTDILTLGDLLTHDIGKPFTDSFTFTDTLLRELMASRSATDITVLSDQLDHLIGKPLAENLLLSDLMGRLFAGQRTFTDVLDVSDLLQRNYVGLRSLTDILQFTDALSTSKFLSATLAEQLQFTDALLRQYFGMRAPTDILTLTDSLLKSFGTNPTDALTLTDTLMKSSRFQFTDALTFLDNLNRLYRGQAVLPESITVTDVLSRQYGAQRALSEILTITENLAAVYTSGGGPTTITINIQDLFNLGDLISKLVTPSSFGVTGGTSGPIAPLVQIQLAAIPRIATLDYITANPMSVQLFLFKPSSILQVIFTATNGNRVSQTVDIFFNITLDGKPYMTTPKAQQVLDPGVPTNVYSWLLVDQPGTYQIIPHAEASPPQTGFSTVTLPTQTVTVEPWQIWITTIILWGMILGPIVVVAIMLTRHMLARRKEAKEEAEST